MREPTQADRAFLEALAGSIGGRADVDRLSEFRTEEGERAKRRCSRYGWAVYHRIGPIWAITPPAAPHSPAKRRWGVGEHDLKALQAENARLRDEMGRVNNEFGSAYPDWPEAWKRVADLKQLAGDRWRETVDLKEQVHVLREDLARVIQERNQARTALADSERMRVEAETRAEALEWALRPFAAAVFDDNSDMTLSTGHVREVDYRHAYRVLRASTTPKETTHVEG